jgi:hypothetical protein
VSISMGKLRTIARYILLNISFLPVASSPIEGLPGL